MNLRPLTEHDLPALMDLQEAGAVAGLGHIFPQETHPFPRPELATRWHDEILDPAVEAWAVEVGGRVRGFVAVRGSQLLHFGTAVDSWGSGLAA